MMSVVLERLHTGSLGDFDNYNGTEVTFSCRAFFLLICIFAWMQVRNVLKAHNVCPSVFIFFLIILLLGDPDVLISPLITLLCVITSPPDSVVHCACVRFSPSTSFFVS